MRDTMWSLAGAMLAVVLTVTPGCVFDPSGVPHDSNDNNGTNSNANANNRNNNNQVNAVCGDSAIEGGEGCDDGNAISGDGCDADCQPEPGWVCSGEPSVCAMTCGNGTQDPGESCDDGNIASGDGCDGQCQLEPGWDCSTVPCEPDCGDTLVVGDEECDDGGTTAGDGCAMDCTVEPFFACAGQPSVCHCVTFVDQAQVSGPRTGARWNEALATVSEGINAASANCEVWVADGVYHVWQGSDDDTINLKSYVSVYGGFAGGETQFDQRNWLQNITELSGYNAAQTERVFHVVTADAVTGALLNGFTVTGGNAKYGKSGGGLYVNDASVTLSQLRVADNDADTSGGGMYAYHSTVTLARSIVTGNYAFDGGGVDVARESQLTVSRCRIVGNQAERGGGLRVFDSSAATVSSSLFVDNSANSLSGGAIVNWSGTDLTVVNCTIYRNTADNDAGAIRNYTANSCTVRNSILWGNVPEDFDDVGTAASLSYTIVGDAGFDGSNGNLSTDPLLLLSDFTLDSMSPAIDTAEDAFAPPVGLGGTAPVDIPGVGAAGTLADRGCFEYLP